MGTYHYDVVARLLYMYVIISVVQEAVWLEAVAVAVEAGPKTSLNLAHSRLILNLWYDLELDLECS